jgi:hypothetical protein
MGELRLQSKQQLDSLLSRFKKQTHREQDRKQPILSACLCLTPMAQAVRLLPLRCYPPVKQGATMKTRGNEIGNKFDFGKVAGHFG